MSFISGGIAEDYFSTSNMLTSAMITRLQKVKKNERIFFEEIKGMGPDGIVVAMSPMIIKVK